MDDLQAGRALRAVRRRLGLRQRDLAARAGVSQQLVSLAERGRLDSLSVRSLRAIGAAAEIRIRLEASWRGGQLARLLDADHAALVDHVASVLRRQGWLVLVEYTFNHFGERGSVDVVGWQPTNRALALIEVKSRIVDVQDLLAGTGRKLRIVPQLLARERGWQADVVGQILVVGESRAARSTVRAHSATFSSSLPARSNEVRAWFRDPARRLAGIWFLALTNSVGDRRKSVAAERVRRVRPRSATASGRPQTPSDPA